MSVPPQSLALPTGSAKMPRANIFIFIAASIFLGQTAWADQNTAAFDRTLGPLLLRRCLDCHSGAAPKGGLNLASAKTVRTGGDSGPVLVPGKPDDSLLWQRVRDGEMPPKKPLAQDEKELIKVWIAAGAKWGTDPIDPFRFTTDKRAGYDWWSLRPLTRPELPTVMRAAWIRNPVDAFVLRQLEARKLAPSAEADRATLIRRLSFDLLGLPPSPAEIDAFSRDADPRAYENLVDRLLASPHYGERWARHWLDVVRFGESDGFERDLPRPNAWPYRDWVVAALNRDLPYDEFVRLQLAGDVLRPEDPDALAATGFLVAGPHDIVLPVSERMKAAMKQDEMEDLIGTVGQTFLGLTVNCARCHDHKFDAITQKDYYRLGAALAGVGHGERTRPDPAVQAKRARTIKQLEALRARLTALEEPARQAVLAERGGNLDRSAPRAIAEWRFTEGLQDRVGSLHGKAFGAARAGKNGLSLDGKSGYVVTEPLPRDLREKTLEAWVRLDRLDQQGGGAMTVQTSDGGIFDAIVFAEREPSRWLAGSNLFQRTQDFGGPAETQASGKFVHVAITYAADGTIAAYRDGLPYGQPYRSSGPIRYQAGAARVVFGVRHEPAGGNRMLAGQVSLARLYDRALSAAEVAASSALQVSDEQLFARLNQEQQAKHARLREEIVRLAATLERKGPPEPKLYAVVPSAPAPTHLLLRGQVDARGELLAPAGVASVSSGFAFALSPAAPDADRRVALARWITDAGNPLFARVMANRLWHYHFGAGLVDTPNDFGFNGGRPTHPELLDWLASELIRKKFSLKAMHRTLVLSATYRQSARPRADAAKVDAENRSLWRMTPRRLEAEAIRDAMLAASGDLDCTIGGKGYADTKSYFFLGTQYYDPIDQVGPAFYRRTLYRLWARGGRSPFLDTFDCPDPSTTTPRRATTTTPVQALALMNNAFVLHMAERLSGRLRREAGLDAGRQVERAFQLTYGRPPDARETEIATKFVERHGLPALCRVLFNSNEFVQVE